MSGVRQRFCVGKKSLGLCKTGEVTISHGLSEHFPNGQVTIDEGFRQIRFEESQGFFVEPLSYKDFGFQGGKSPTPIFAFSWKPLDCSIGLHQSASEIPA